MADENVTLRDIKEAMQSGFSPVNIALAKMAEEISTLAKKMEAFTAVEIRQLQHDENLRDHESRLRHLEKTVTENSVKTGITFATFSKVAITVVGLAISGALGFIFGR